MALAAGPDGSVWVGTEGRGVWRWQAGAREPWRQFTTADGLGDDDAYALTIDRAGRVWVGHLDHGVSVYNGQIWRNYDVLSGPLGERIYALAAAPGGDVWMATNRGLARWQAAGDRWRYYTAAEGLPGQAFVALACDARGRVFAGSACDGLVWATPDDDYRVWRAVAGRRELVTRAAGQGDDKLPSGQINALLVTADQNVWVATPAGLARGGGDLRRWDWVRGRDWDEKVRDATWPPPKGWRADGPGALAEDYVSALAEDGAGRLWVGYRRAGIEVFGGSSGPLGERLGGKPVFAVTAPPKQAADPVRAILPRADGAPLVATYGGGLREAAQGARASLATPSPGGPAGRAGEDARAPRPAAPPTRDELVAMLARVMGLTRPLPVGAAALVGEDWQTRGDWVGRYGRQDATLCAMQAPLDQVIGYGSAWLTRGRIGPHCRAGDSLRYWVHWLRTDDPRTLWSPLLGHRRQSDWDDHGEDYPATWDGPDVWAEVSVPAGVHRVSLYFVNKDGHDGPNRWRDYLVEVKPHRQGVRTADAEPPFARARVSDFWGGKYLQFVARGPATLDFKIDRHYSFNTILQAVFLDRLSGPRLPEEQTMPAPLLGLPPTADHEPVTGGLAGKLWRELDSAWEREGSALWQQPWRVLCYRAALAGGSTADLAAWRDALPLWLASDRAQQRALAQRAWAVLAARQPRLAQRPAR